MIRLIFGGDRTDRSFGGILGNNDLTFKIATIYHALYKAQNRELILEAFVDAPYCLTASNK